MDELPPPDLRDSTGRMRRLVVAFVCAVVAASIAYGVTTQLAKPDTQVTTGAFRFVFYITALVGGAVFLIALKVQNHLADRTYRASLGVPPAKAVERRD